MKSLIRRTTFAIIAAGSLMSASAATFDFHVRPPGGSTFDLADLDHKRAYEFGVRNWSAAGHQVVSASLTFYNIYDWQVEDDNLFITLLDDPSGTTGYESYGPQYALSHARYSTFSYQGRLGSTGDNPNDIANQGNDFAGLGVDIGSWSDPVGGTPTGLNLTFTFTADQLAALQQYIQDGNFALGIDPDCHYYNDGVVFTVNTSVPDSSGTLALFVLGLGCLFVYKGKVLGRKSV